LKSRLQDRLLGGGAAKGDAKGDAKDGAKSGGSTRDVLKGLFGR